LQQGLAKAWIRFNGSGTVAIVDSLNFASITDNATGHYTNTFTNAMATANYLFGGSAVPATAGDYSRIFTPAGDGTSSTTAYAGWSVQSWTAAPEDMPAVFSTTHGDLA